jgi:hypothetical protein
MKPMPPPYWQLISERVYKTDLGDDKPEVVVILMPDKAFKKFSKSKKAAMAYIDGLHLLKKKLNGVVFADIAPQKGDDGGEWFVIITHTTHSTMSVVAWQLQPPAPPPAPQKVPMSELRKPPSKRAPGAPKPEKQ